MKKHFLLTKTLLVALLCLVGQSVWATDVVLNPSADTYFDWSNSTTSYGSEQTLYCGIWQEMWTNATPGLKANGSEKIAVFKFDVSSYKGKITSAAFKVTATNPSTNSNTRSIYLGYFDVTNWDESSTAATSGMVTRAASGLNIHPFNISQSINKGQTKEVSFSGDAFLTYLNNDADGIVSLIIYGVGQECSVNSKDATSGKPSLELSYTNETLYTATFNESNSLNPVVTVYTDAERTSEIASNQLAANTTYYYTAKLAGYEDFNGSFAVTTSNPVVNFTMTALPRYTFKVNLVNGGAVIKTLYTDEESYDGKKHDVSFSKYLVDAENKVTYSKDNTTYFTSYTSASTSPTQEVSYTPYNGVAYFFEGESFAALGTKTNNANYSGNTAGRGLNNTTMNIMTIPVTGTYDLSWAVCSNNTGTGKEVTYKLYRNSSSDVIYVDEALNHSVNYVKTTGSVDEPGVEFAEGDVLQLFAGSTNVILDYVLVELKALPATLGTNGYATFASPYALDLTTANLPNGVTAYKASVSGTTVTFTALNQTVPANTGILLKGEDTVNIPVVATGDAVEDNLFLVNADGTTFADDANYYFFGLVKNSLTFGTFDPSAVAIPANKAYLKVLKSSVTNPARGLDIVFDDDVTGISAIEKMRNEGNETFFDLQGRKVAQPQKGLYIVNGKKVMVK